MAEVVGLRGRVPPGEPVPGVVEELEDLLRRARSGEVRAFVAGFVQVDGAVATSWCWSPDDPSEPLVAVASILNYRVLRELVGG